MKDIRQWIDDNSEAFREAQRVKETRERKEQERQVALKRLIDAFSWRKK